MGVLFDEHVAPFYEAWFETGEGRRADRLEKALLDRLSALLDPPGTLLEVGCGTGHFARWFGERGWHVLGLDHSLPMLSQARARGHEPLVLGDALALPFPDGAVDVVALITALEFLGEPEMALAEAWRVAGRGLLLGVLNRLGPVAWIRRIQGRFRPTVYDTARFYRPGELVRLVRGTAGGRVALRWGTTLWPRWLPLEGGPLHWGAFVGLAARVVQEHSGRG
jgi:ubiquinone/menaquinone biosynthesis C-methylase UbiE